MEKMLELMSKVDVQPTGNKHADYEAIQTLNDLAHKCRENGWKDSAERFEKTYLALIDYCERNY